VFAGPAPHVLWVEPAQGSAHAGQVLTVAAVNAREGFTLIVSGMPCNASAFSSEPCDGMRVFLLQPTKANARVPSPFGRFGGLPADMHDG